MRSRIGLPVLACALLLAACQTGRPGATLRTEQALVGTTPLTLQVRSDHCFLSPTDGGPVDGRIWEVFRRSTAAFADLVAVVASCAEVAAANDGFGQSLKSIGLVYIRTRDGRRQRLAGVSRAAYIDAVVASIRDGSLIDPEKSEENLRRTLGVLRDMGVRPVVGAVEDSRIALVEHDHAGVILRSETTRARNFSAVTEVTILGLTLVDGWPVTVEFSVPAGTEREIVAQDVVKSLIRGLAGEQDSI